MDPNPMHKWADDLRDVHFWLDGYRLTGAYHGLRERMYNNGYVHWNVGVHTAQEREEFDATVDYVLSVDDIERITQPRPPLKSSYYGIQETVRERLEKEANRRREAALTRRKKPRVSFFTRSVAAMAVEAISQVLGPFDVIVEVELNEEDAKRRGLGVELNEEDAELRGLGVELALAAAVAQELDNQEYSRLKQADDELRHCTCGMENCAQQLKNHLRGLLYSDTIPDKLRNKKHLLVVHNLYEPIPPLSFADKVGPRPNARAPSQWVISTTTLHARDKSKVDGEELYGPFTHDEIIMVIFSALHQSAKCIFDELRWGDEQYWHLVALRCFLYAMLLLPRRSSPHKATPREPSAPTSNELIHQWAAQGVLPMPTIIRVQGKISIKEDTNGGRCDDIHHIGNVILQAFHKYSLLLLPFSPPSDANAANQTAAHFLAWHGPTAEGLCKVDELLDRMDSLKWISLVENCGWHFSNEWLNLISGGPTALILRHCSLIPPSLIFSHGAHFLAMVSSLRVLDLSYTPLESLPPSIGRLLNLHLLSLRGCTTLQTLFVSSASGTIDSPTNGDSYSPLSTLYQLEFLDMNGAPFSDMSQDIGNRKHNLTHMDMSHSNITKFPPNFFQDMSNLEVLLLVQCPNLKELPPSMAVLCCLRTLEVTRTQITTFPDKIFQKMRNLRSLKLIDNELLMSFPEAQDRPEELEGRQIRTFILDGAPHVRRLSLRGCRELNYVELRNLAGLKELHLSATAITELPAEIPNLPQLRELLLLGVCSLRRFPWHMVWRLPECFCLDQYADGNIDPSDKVVRVLVIDPRLFHSFNKYAAKFVKDGRFLQSFYVQVAPCMDKIKKARDEENMVDKKLQELVVEKRSSYADVYHHCMEEGVNCMAPRVKPPIRRTERHVEISAMHHQPSYGLDYLLRVTKSISVTHGTSIPSLSSLSNFGELEECELLRCRGMEWVLKHPADVKTLRNLHAGYITTLAHVCHPEASFGDQTFSALQHLRLEHCPRLEDMMPCETELPWLVTLELIFCYNLRTIFYGPGTRSNGCQWQLPRLRRVCLQELPRMQRLLREDDAVVSAPAWEELRVRGCWSLRRLPRLAGGEGGKVVGVSGERAWWSRLRWDEAPQHRGAYEPKLPPAFASFHERAKATSFLR